MTGDADLLSDAVALSAAIRDRRISCVEVMTATLDRVERLNPKVNAIIALRPRETLIAEARACDDDISRGLYRGVLHGFPQAIKDLEPGKGIPTSMGVLGPMARNIPDLALLLGVQAGYDARAPLSIVADLDLAQLDLNRDFRGTRIAWSGDMAGYLPFEDGVLDTCRAALKTFEDMGCVVEEANPDFSIDAVWRAWLVLRAWQAGTGLLEVYKNPSLRPHMKPEAVFEVERGAKLTAYEISAASMVRTQWYEAVRRFFETYDYWLLPTAQLFPFDVDLDWPHEIAGRPMQTYHEWMKVVLPVTMSGCPALAAPAGFGARDLPIGIQIVAPNHGERDCLELGHAYDQRTNLVRTHLPPLLNR